MSIRWYSVVVDCCDVVAQSRWWAVALDWRVAFEAADEVVVVPSHALDSARDIPRLERAPAARPDTVMGLYLRAVIMRDDAGIIDRLGRRLNNGQSGWNRDEAGVMQAACDLAARRYFGPGYDIREVSDVVSFMRSANLAGGKTPHGQLETEAVIRHALGETDVDVKGINAQVAFEVQIEVTAFIVWKSKFTEPQVDELITEAERLARKRGWDPPIPA
jgi:hypothetical protein